jgi:hypothetical protein
MTNSKWQIHVVRVDRGFAHLVKIRADGAQLGPPLLFALRGSPVFRISAFGLPSDFGLRFSDFRP